MSSAAVALAIAIAAAAAAVGAIIASFVLLRRDEGRPSDGVAPHGGSAMATGAGIGGRAGANVTPATRSTPDADPGDLWAGPPPVRGTLRMGRLRCAGSAAPVAAQAHDRRATGPAPGSSTGGGAVSGSSTGDGAVSPDGGVLRGVAEYVNSRGYAGMQDNDLRGFVDGTFYLGWNQPGQVHVRIGRVSSGPGSSAPPGRAPVYGEHELFRVLQRWEGIRLPAGARVTRAMLRLAVEEPAEATLRILVYAVQRDWDPGSGGVDRNNVSVPAPGEVWWNEAAHEERAWGLPGAGFAARGHPEADVDVAPLAETVWEPDAPVVEFSSPAFAGYIQGRLERDLPLLFLIKLSDFHEDLPGAKLDVYSGEFGDGRNPALRPRLTLEWEAPISRLCLEESVFLEYGRTWVLPPVAVERGAAYAMSWSGAAVSARPTIEVRAGDGWARVGSTCTPDGDCLQLRIVAAPQPLTLGERFTSELRDTWVLTAPAEHQEVRWTFTSPTGVRYEVPAVYGGDYRWSVSFSPDEIGPWRYRWSHEFIGTPCEGPVGGFDVVGGDADNVRARLEELAGEIEEAGIDRHSDAMLPFRVRFSRLQRAALQTQNPGSWRSPEGEALRRLLRRVRSVLWVRQIPDPIPMESMAVRTEAGGRRLRDPVPEVSHVPFRAGPPPGAEG